MSDAAAAPPRKSLWRFAPLAVIALGLALAYAAGAHKYLSLDGVVRFRDIAQSAIDERPLASLALFVAAYAVATALSIPGAAFLTLAGGFLFGTWLGGSAALVGALIGAIAIFSAARTAFADGLRARVGGFLGRLEEGFRANAFNYLLSLRLIPAVPFWALNLAPAFLGVSLKDFALASAIGMAPGAFVYASLGAGAAAAVDRGEEPSLSLLAQPEILFALLGLAVLSLAPVAFKALRKGKQT